MTSTQNLRFVTCVVFLNVLISFCFAGHQRIYFIVRNVMAKDIDAFDGIYCINFKQCLRVKHFSWVQSPRCVAIDAKRALRCPLLPVISKFAFCLGRWWARVHKRPVQTIMAHCLLCLSSLLSSAKPITRFWHWIDFDSNF